MNILNEHKQSHVIEQLSKLGCNITENYTYKELIKKLIYIKSESKEEFS